MLTRGPIVPEVQKIAVLRANAIGDFLLALPALEALRATYPPADIVLLATAWHASFLHDRPGPIDRVVVVPPTTGVNEGGGHGDPAEQASFFAAMQEEHFDLAIQLHGGGRFSNPFVRRLGARITVGSKTPDAVALDRWVPYTLYQHETLRFLEVVGLVGATTTQVEPRLTQTAHDAEEAARVVSPGTEPMVVLHPGATDVRRQWPPDRFAAVGDALAAAGAQIFIVGTEPERRVVDAVVDAMTYGAHNLCGRLSLQGLTGLLARCCLVVGNDSGPAHLARAVGTATVTIYWCLNLINAGPVARVHHRVVVSWQNSCPVCGTHLMQASCNHPVSIVSDVAVDDVLAPALELFAEHQHHQRIQREESS